jgi:hypothetical protein
MEGFMKKVKLRIGNCVFDSMQEAADILGLKYGSLSQAVKTKAPEGSGAETEIIFKGLVIVVMRSPVEVGEPKRPRRRPIRLARRKGPLLKTPTTHRLGVYGGGPA